MPELRFTRFDIETLRRAGLIVLLMLAGPSACDTATSPESSASASNGCLECHASSASGFNVVHSFAESNCVVCHAGDAQATEEEAAHADLIAFPGDLASIEQSCGHCHADSVASVMQHPMHSGHGMVATTRSMIDGSDGEPGTANLQSLALSVADSMLRKQCASCHLGQPKTEHALDVTFDRGGGCAACHVNEYPEQGHVALTTRVSDGRCFGCHSRSGRVSLSYTGLAEIGTHSTDSSDSLLLADGRRVERMHADVHHEAGMACIDCHTGTGLMGDAGGHGGVDIACTDCHANDGDRVMLEDWPESTATMARHVPFAADAGTEFLATSRNGTPLWHIELRGNGAWLHTKNTGRVLEIPALQSAAHEEQHHERLECNACHSQWAPQCFDCHMEYDPDGEQWDHIEREVTAGRWSEGSWHARNALPTLGVDENGRIVPFVPGMIMTVEHPDFESGLFVRAFAPLSPHTTGSSRSCTSCHADSDALGLGDGKLVEEGGSLAFYPSLQSLADGLPLDAWTNLDGSLGGRTPDPAQRPFTPFEIRAIFDAEIEDEDAQQDSVPETGGGSSSSSSVNTGGTNGSARSSGRADAPERSPTK